MTSIPKLLKIVQYPIFCKNFLRLKITFYSLDIK